MRSERGEIRVVAVDDHPTFADGLRTLLEASTDDIRVVGVATKAEEATDLVGEMQPDIVLLDLRMPRDEGFEAAKKIRSMHPQVKVVILTASDERGDAREAMRLGLHGFLSKQADIDELIAAIRAVSAGDIVLTPFAASTPFDETSDEDRHLTVEEVRMLRLAARGSDNATMARELNVSESTLKRMFNQVQRKLGVENRTQAVVQAVRRWLI